MQSDPDNCIDDSLSVTISALGGGLLRHPADHSQEFAYKGDLADFASAYYNADSINIPVIATSAIAAVAVAALVVALTRGRSRIRKKEEKSTG
jgi:hypothetical protein